MTIRTQKQQLLYFDWRLAFLRRTDNWEILGWFSGKGCEADQFGRPTAGLVTFGVDNDWILGAKAAYESNSTIDRMDWDGMLWTAGMYHCRLLCVAPCHRMVWVSHVFQFHDPLLLLALPVHEVVHAMGFSGSNFDVMRDEKLNPRGLGAVSIENPLDWQVNSETAYAKTYIETPRTKQIGRRYFNCPTLRGVEIEDEGGPSSQGGHWEKRILYNEVLQSQATDLMTHFSAFTLAYMEDTGWYRAVYTDVTVPFWGQNQGCTFAESPCTEWGERLRFHVPRAILCPFPSIACVAFFPTLPSC